MFKPLISLVFIVFSGISAWSFTPTASDCSDFHVRHGAFHYQRHSFSDGTCVLMMDPFDVHNFIYRSYLISSQGLFMVFNSYSPNENSKSTGARVFHFFPRRNLPEITADQDEVRVKFSAPQIELVLSQENDQILRMTGGKIKEDPKVQSSNKGGVEISNVKTLYLDSGFTLGRDPTGDPDRTSIFYDSKGHNCAVQNKEVFKYDSDGDSNLRFSDAELKGFLRSRCPRLVLGF